MSKKGAQRHRLRRTVSEIGTPEDTNSETSMERERDTRGQHKMSRTKRDRHGVTEKDAYRVRET